MKLPEFLYSVEINWKSRWLTNDVTVIKRGVVNSYWDSRSLNIKQSNCGFAESKLRIKATILEEYENKISGDQFYSMILIVVPIITA